MDVFHTSGDTPSGLYGVKPQQAPAVRKQMTRPVKPTECSHDLVVNDDDILERVADRMGNK